MTGVWDSTSWTFIGLCVEIVGVVIIFKYGPPQPDFDEAVNVSITNPTTVLSNGKTVAQHQADVKNAKRIYRKWAFTALSLILVGLVLQLYDAWPKIR